jgi:hypothetical protein
MKEELLAYLSQNKIEFYFEYDPYGESEITCTNDHFKEFLLEKMFEYVMNSGDPIGGNFIATRKNNDIIIRSVGSQKVNWDHDPDIAINVASVEEIERLIYNTYTNKTDNWSYYLNVSMNSSGCNLHAKIYEGDNMKEIKNNEFTKEIASYIIDKIGGPNYDGSHDYGYDCQLTNSGDGNKFTEYFPLSIEV